jgi:phage shock protein PspC (stress-responsive transcriptional regulator)
MAGENGRSIADVLEDIAANVQGIIRAEIRLARTETKEEITVLRGAAGMMAGGAIASLFTVSLLLLTILFALSIVMPLWAAALLLFLVMTVVSFTLLILGKRRLKAVQTTPKKTIETIKENVQWVKNQSK